MEGEEIAWRSVNGIKSGIVVGRHKKGWIVKIANSEKKSIVHPKSIIHVKTAQ